MCSLLNVLNGVHAKFALAEQHAEDDQCSFLQSRQLRRLTSPSKLYKVMLTIPQPYWMPLTVVTEKNPAALTRSGQVPLLGKGGDIGHHGNQSRTRLSGWPAQR